MAYGTVKVDTIIFDQGGADQNATVSGIYRAITSGVTVSGTIAGAVLIGTTTVSGTTVTGTTANFASGVFTTQVSGTTVTGTQSSFTSGNFVTLSGATATFTSGVIASGTAAAPSLSILGDPNTGIYSPGADQVAVATNGVGRLFIASDGKVAVNTTPTYWLHVAAPAGAQNIFLAGQTGVSNGYQIDSTGSAITHIWSTVGGEKVRLTDAGLVGIGTTSPNALLDVRSATAWVGDGTTDAFLQFNQSATAANRWHIGAGSANAFIFYKGTYGTGVETARIDSSGRLLVGTSSWSDRATSVLQGNSTDGATGPGYLTLSRGLAPGSLGAGNSIGVVDFTANNAGSFAQIVCEGDGASGTNDYPGRLMFFTTADGAASPTERMRITSAGNVGIGTTSPQASLGFGTSIDTTPTDVSKIQLYNSGGAIYGFGVSTNQLNYRAGTAGDAHVWYAGFAEKARIDSGGRLLVGTSTARSTFYSTASAFVQIEGGAASGGESLAIVRNVNDIFGGSLILAKTRGAGDTIVTSGDTIGNVTWQGNDGSKFVQAARIEAQVDGTPGADDMPGRLVFFTTADGQSTPTERMRITSAGYLKVSDNNSYQAVSVGRHELNQSANEALLISHVSNTGYTGDVHIFNVNKAANSDYVFLRCYSNTFADTEFNLRGDGNAFADGSWTGGGADYAEYFEWSDSNPNTEDRRGISVVLDGDKIREAVVGEDPIGVISGNPSVVGDAAWNKWSGKYLRDEFGTYIQEGYEVEDEDGNTVVQQRRKLNPAYDPDVEYVSREQRPEWDCVGLMGKLRIRKGQITGSRWIKMRDINDFVEEWLVR